MIEAEAKEASIKKRVTKIMGFLDIFTVNT